MLFQNSPTQKRLSGLAACLRLGLISHNYLEPMVETRDLLLSRLAGYFLLSSMHSYTPVLFDGDKNLHVLLNLLQGSKHLLISIM